MEKFQEIDFKSIGDQKMIRDDIQVNVKKENIINNENYVVNIQMNPQQNKEPECKIFLIKIFSLDFNIISS